MAENNEISMEDVNESLGIEETAADLSPSIEPVTLQWSYKLPTNEIFLIKTTDPDSFKSLVKEYRTMFKLPAIKDLPEGIVNQEIKPTPITAGPMCPIHHVPMEQRMGKNGRPFTSHALPDGTYCYGKKFTNTGF